MRNFRPLCTYFLQSPMRARAQYKYGKCGEGSPFHAAALVKIFLQLVEKIYKCVTKLCGCFYKRVL